MFSPKSRYIVVFFPFLSVLLLSMACVVTAPPVTETPTAPPVTETPTSPPVIKVPMNDGEPLVLYTTIPTSQAEIPRITPEDLKAIMDKGEPVIIVDCNQKGSYKNQHIPGAINIPWSFSGLKEDPGLSRSTLIVAYCACEHEEDSAVVAMQMITQFGYRNIKLLLDGNPKWEYLGYPLEKGE